MVEFLTLAKKMTARHQRENHLTSLGRLVCKEAGLFQFRSEKIPQESHMHPFQFGFPLNNIKQGKTTAIGVFTLVTRGWAASEFLMCASTFNMTPNGAF